MSHVLKGTIFLAGNPNAGKTTLFNLLTGSSAKVANYPGVTVDRRAGQLELEGQLYRVLDLPGTYSLTARSPEEQIAVRSLIDEATARDVVVVVVDATTLSRGLYLVEQLHETGLRFVVALNMMDEARQQNIVIDTPKLAAELGAEVVPVVASKNEGRAELLAAIARTERRSSKPPTPEAFAELAALEPIFAKVDQAVVATHGPRAFATRAYSFWAILSLGDDEMVDVPVPLREAVTEAFTSAQSQGVALHQAIIEARYRRVDRLISLCVRAAARRVSLTDRVDTVLLHPVAGFVVFAIVMGLIFQAIFSWTTPVADVLEGTVSALQGLLRQSMPPGHLVDLLVGGVLAGVGNVVVFVPQIALLFLFVAIMEDSGYLARVAFVIDRVMGRVGLHGKAFVPMLSGFACAVPAVLATRTIESRRDRLLTMLAIPFTSCSARLPVYVLIIGTVFANSRATPVTDLLLPIGVRQVPVVSWLLSWLPIMSLGSVVLLVMYFFSAFAAVFAAAFLRRTVLRGPTPPLVLELPPYRRPLARNLALATGRSVQSFLREAGTVILAMTVVMWALVSFPKSDAIAKRHEAERQSANILEPRQRKDRLAEIADIESAAQMEYSVAGRIGKLMEPALTPLGWDWRIGVGILGAFTAREVFVSTLGVVFGVGDAVDEESAPLHEKLSAARTRDGSRLFTPLSGVTLMVFFVLACQCMSTVAVVRRESGSWKWPVFMVVFMTTVAYLASLLVYQFGHAFGWGL